MSLIRAISITAPTGYEMDRAGIDAALGRNKLTRTDPIGIWYLRVDWHHGHADDPVTIYSEVGAGGYEYRKVHRFIDGTLEWADKNHEGDRTGLGKKPVGTVEEISAQEVFTPLVITQDQFYAVWHEAQEQA